MDWHLALLIAVLLLQVASGVLLFRRTTGSREMDAKSVARLSSRDHVRQLERIVDRKVDLLLEELQWLRKQLPSLSSTRSEMESHPSPPRHGVEASDYRKGVESFDVEKPLAVLPDSRRRTRPFERPRMSLTTLLDEPEFLEGVWGELDQSMTPSLAKLYAYLEEKKAPKPQVKVIPPEPDHWRFFVVSSASVSDDEVSVLIPRHFQRYDPNILDHLFDVRGVAHFDSSLRELRKCALLEPGAEGRLDADHIPASLVRNKGVVVV